MSEILRAFRQNVVQVRHALAELDREPGPPRLGAGRLEDEALIERYQQLSIPVRRAMNPDDRAAVARALGVLDDLHGHAVALEQPRAAWRDLEAELDSLVGLGGGKVARRQIVAGWLEVAAFFDRRERIRSYDQFIELWGTAAEGMGVEFTAQAARALVLLDEAVARALGEPIILPAPEKTPPPPRDPTSRWWKNVFSLDWMRKRRT